MPTVKVRDINMYYEIHGEGEPLVLIHGILDISGWSNQIPTLSQRYRVVAFDNRGVGRTDSTEPPYTTAGMADDTVGLLDVLGIDQAHIVGYSLGGAIALELAIKYPERVKNLILVGAFARLSPIGLSRTHLLMSMFRNGVDIETVLRNFYLWFFSDKFFSNEEQVTAALNSFINHPFPQPSHGLEGQVDAITGHDSRDRLGRITAPTLVLVGKDDINTPVKLSEQLATGIPDAKLVVLEDTAHSLPIEAPDRFNKIILDWLEKTGMKNPATPPP